MPPRPRPAAAGDGRSFGYLLRSAGRNAASRLIAAAPELYEAVETALAELTELHRVIGGSGECVSLKVIAHLEAVLAKARGEQ